MLTKCRLDALVTAEVCVLHFFHALIFYATTVCNRSQSTNVQHLAGDLLEAGDHDGLHVVISVVSGEPQVHIASITDAERPIITLNESIRVLSRDAQYYNATSQQERDASSELDDLREPVATHRIGRVQ